MNMISNSNATSSYNIKWYNYITVNIKITWLNVELIKKYTVKNIFTVLIFLN